MTRSDIANVDLLVLNTEETTLFISPHLPMRELFACRKHAACLVGLKKSSRSSCITMEECLPCACLARYFYCDFPRFNPQVHHYPMKPQDGECDDGRVGERPRTRLPSTRGSKGTSGGTSIVGIDGDGAGDSRLGIPEEMESTGHR